MIERHELGARVYVRQRRIHHGALGFSLWIAGAILMYHDRADVRRWLPDLLDTITPD